MNIELRTILHPHHSGIGGSCNTKNPNRFITSKDYSVIIYLPVHKEFQNIHGGDLIDISSMVIAHEVIHGEIGKIIPRFGISYWGEENAVLSLTGQNKKDYFLHSYPKFDRDSKLRYFYFSIRDFVLLMCWRLFK